MVKMGRRVCAIHWNEQLDDEPCVRLELEGGMEVTARFAIVTASLGVLKNDGVPSAHLAMHVS